METIIKVLEAGYITAMEAGIAAGDKAAELGNLSYDEIAEIEDRLNKHGASMYKDKYYILQAKRTFEAGLKAIPKYTAGYELFDAIEKLKTPLEEVFIDWDENIDRDYISLKMGARFLAHDMDILYDRMVEIAASNLTPWEKQTEVLAIQPQCDTMQEWFEITALEVVNVSVSTDITAALNFPFGEAERAKAGDWPYSEGSELFADIDRWVENGWVDEADAIQMRNIRTALKAL